MLYHHDERDYAVAASEAALHARAKLEDIIQVGRAQAESVYSRAMSEVPTDRLIRAPVLDFVPSETGVNYRVKHKTAVDAAVEEILSDTTSFSQFALTQVAQRAQVPLTYLTHLRGTDWGRTLLAHIFNETYSQQNKKYLLREVDGTVRGFLSDKFLRLDSRPLLDAFVKACQTVGAVPYQGRWMETRFSMKAVLPLVFEPVENEVMAYGVSVQNSDYGDGQYAISTFLVRLWCTNTALGENELSRVHIGSRLTDDQFSEKTQLLSIATLESATEDVLNKVLSPEHVHKRIDVVRQAHEAHVAPAQVPILLKNMGLQKAEADAVKDKFASADIELLPPGQTKWRLSNAVSWFAAHETEDARRAEDLERAAYRILGA